MRARIKSLIQQATTGKTARSFPVLLVTFLLAAPHGVAANPAAASELLSEATGPGEAPAAAVEGAEDPATYGADHLVAAGAEEPGQEVKRLEYLAYYPTNLQIHRGDVVFFRIDGFHTVTFSPQAEPRQPALRRDEVEPLTVFKHALPSDPACGTSAEKAPCVLGSTDQLVNSGVEGLVDGLKLQVDLTEGAYKYHCTIHAGMEGTIEVVPDEEPIPSASDVAAQREDEIAADTATARNILNNPPEMRVPENVPATPTSPAHRRWFVQAGQISADHRVAVLQYFPSSLEINPGDEVEFFVPPGGPPPPGRTEVAGESHTASFEPRALHDACGSESLPGLAEDLACDGFIRYLNPMCDPDDPESGLQGAPIFTAIFFGCPEEGLTLEIGLPPYAFPQYAMRAPGNAVATEATYDDSGILMQPDQDCRIGCDPWTGERIPSTSTSFFPAEGQFLFSCFLHGRTMGGSITVTG